MASWERFQATRTAMQELAAESASEEEGMRWYRIELALVLAEATGRRLGSIQHLRWEDLNFDCGVITWRAEYDKQGKSAEIPYPDALWIELKQFRRKIGAVGGWLFAAELNLEVPMDRHLFDKWLGVAEKGARLPKLDGGIWHPTVARARRPGSISRSRMSLQREAGVIQKPFCAATSNRSSR